MSTSGPTPPIQGWARFHGRKFHYYGPNGTALCGKSLALSGDPQAFEDSGHDHPQNCAECRRRKLRESGP